MKPPSLESSAVAHVVEQVEQRLRALFQLDRADRLSKRVTESEARASRLSDKLGELRTERDELLRENAQWRRKYEQLERKVKR